MNPIESEQKQLINYIKDDFEEPLLNCDLKDFITGNSKRIRSSLALLYLKAHGLSISDEVYNVLAAGEIIHNASLMHDDIIDNADIRRGEPVIARKYSRETAILAGDYLLSYAIGKLLKIKDFEVLSEFKKCTEAMTKSEIEQYLNRGIKVDGDSYINICIGKTAKLFAVMMGVSSLLSKLDYKIAYDFGELYGICFQINNDLEDKSSVEDSKNGIMTAKDIFGIEKTYALLDNYKKKMYLLLCDIPENEYRYMLEDLVNKL